MKEAYITLTYLITATEEEVGNCDTEEEFETKVQNYTNELIEDMGIITPNDVEIEIKR